MKYYFNSVVKAKYFQLLPNQNNNTPGLIDLLMSYEVLI